MERLSLKSLSADYVVQSRYVVETEEKYCSVFTCTYHLNTVYDKASDRYNFRIGRSKVMIDGKAVRKLMDRIMLEIGNSVYPLSFTVSPQLQIVDLVNYDEIKQRWIECTKRLSEEHPSHQLDRYIKMAKENISDVQSFINSLYRDTFFNVHFRDIYTPMPDDEARTIVWENFPKREMNQTYLYRSEEESENKIRASGEVMKIVPEQEGSYTMDYELGEMGEIINISGSVESRYRGLSYMKQISVKAENVKLTGILQET